MNEWKWYWGAGSQPEMYHEAMDRNDAVAQAEEDARENGYEQMTICEGRPQPLRDDIFDAGRVLERFCEVNEELSDEDGDLHVNDVTVEQEQELEEALNKVFAEWRAKHELGRAWPLETRNEEVITIDPRVEL